VLEQFRNVPLQQFRNVPLSKRTVSCDYLKITGEENAKGDIRDERKRS